MLALAPLLTLLTTTTALALPQGTTGPSGTQPYATSTNITLYQGVTASTGSSFQSLYPDDSNSCGQRVSEDVIEAGVCRKFLTQGVGIWGTVNGSCTLALWEGSDDCSGGTTRVVKVENGVDRVTCAATGVMDGGEHYKGSGVWTCG